MQFTKNLVLEYGECDANTFYCLSGHFEEKLEDTIPPLPLALPAHATVLHWVFLLESNLHCSISENEYHTLEILHTIVSNLTSQPPSLSAFSKQ